MSKALERKLAAAQTYDEWVEAALAHDEHNGLGKWKQREKTSLYDYATIRRRLDRLEILRGANDNHGLLFNLNEGIHGNLGGMGSGKLYQRAKFGTKQLIVDYVEEVTSALEHLAKPKVKGVNRAEKIDFFHRANLCFGSSALLMSGSGTYLFFHVGVLKALWEQDLIPKVISGSSGGAFIAAVAGSRPADELGEIFEPEFVDLESQLKNLFDSLSPIRRKKKTNMGEHEIKSLVETLIPDLTFEEAYKVSGLQVNITIAPAERHQKSRLLNAITSPNVMLREAVLASCCIPGVFPAVTLAAKNVDGERVPYLPNRKWVDGSLSDDLPMKRLSRLYGVNHFIVSQTNPLVLPFVSAEKNPGGVLSTLSNTGLKTMKDWGLAASHLLQKPFSSDSYFSKLINGYISVVSQTYTGDINILPSSKLLNPTKIIAIRSNKEIDELIADGERATWPALERIRIQTRISRTLSDIIERLNRKPTPKQTKLKVVAK